MKSHKPKPNYKITLHYGWYNGHLYYYNYYTFEIFKKNIGFYDSITNIVAISLGMNTCYCVSSPLTDQENCVDIRTGSKLSLHHSSKENARGGGFLIILS
jgi:hypothetical protein